MNDKRRKAISAVAETVREALSDLEALRDEEVEAFDNMPEGLQESERGQQSQAAAEALGEALEALLSATDSLETACE